MNIIVSGILGRMGRTVCDAAADAPDMHVVGGVDAAADSPKTIKVGGGDVPVFGDWNAVDVEADAIIDFSHYTAVPALLRYAVAQSLPVVVCTTGLGEAERDAMRDAARSAPVFNSSNMSLGIGVVKNMARLAVPALERDFNVEITEAHHKMKKESPSGTAIMLADAINETCATHKDYVYGRHGKSDEVKISDLGIHAIRGGTIPGKHTILFAGPGETIEITHTAYTRDIFALGAIKAARYIADKQPGLYTMDDLI
ncbi:MAG: 4-hydroxy-tetrahydrodipicolinate reductase [Clostridiales Family XIII bacterium]|jgi:4-hydroxy-tetrahydrodipicolinate reductase|nr:4-hydroxy-tetrahydrodipicolinate reductase [Clostridiales Family XIII bacterium]